MTITTRTRTERTRRTPPDDSHDPLVIPGLAEMRDCVVVEIPRVSSKRDLSTRVGSSPVDTPRKRRTTGPAIESPVISLRKSKSPPPGTIESRPRPTRTPSKITTNRSNNLHGEKNSPKLTTTSPKSTSRPQVNMTIHAGGEDGNPFISSSVSREVFLSNEALRRQREARNFQFVGDHMAPVALRSGKTMVRRGVHELDEYGDVVSTATVRDGGVEQDEREATNDAVEVRETNEYHIPLSLDNTAVSHGPPRVPSLDNKISSLYSHLIARLANAAVPTVTEVRDDKTDVMQEAISLLMGTVEKGEGNSCLLIGARGSGKTRTINAAIGSVCRRRLDAPKPIVVRLSGLIHTTDRLAIREMGRQISEAEGRAIDGQDQEEEGEEEFAPTTLPSHLLSQLTMPSPRAVVVVIDNFDLFTDHPRQALLYCLLDVAQSINTGMGSQSGRGIAVVGLTSRVDTLLLLEKRVKSRFSHRILRVPSPLTTAGGWEALLQDAFLSPSTMKVAHEGWKEHANMLLADTRVKSRMDLLAGLTTDVRVLFRPVISCLTRVAVDRTALGVDELLTAINEQIHLSGWGNAAEKLKGLSHPALAILIIGKHLAFAGREEFNFAQVEAEYQRFSRTKLVGSGKTRWSSSVLRKAFDQLVSVNLLVPTGPSRSAANHANPRFARVRSLLQPYEVVQYFKGQGANTLSVELGNWGRMMGGHA